MPLFTKTAGNYFVAHNATITGEVEIAELASFWFTAVVRGDVAPVTIGHRAVVHGTHVGQGSLIGMGAVLLGQTKIGRECLVAAGAVVPPGLVVPDRMAVMGVPGKIVRPVREDELKYMRWLTGHYVELAERYVLGEDARVKETL